MPRWGEMYSRVRCLHSSSATLGPQKEANVPFLYVVTFCLKMGDTLPQPARHVKAYPQALDSPPRLCLTPGMFTQLSEKLSETPGPSYSCPHRGAPRALVLGAPVDEMGLTKLVSHRILSVRSLGT